MRLVLLGKQSDPEFFEDIVQNHAAEHVDLGPGQFTPVDAVHRGEVARSPGVGKSGPVEQNALFLAEAVAFANNAAAEIDTGPEHVKRQ